MDRVGIVKQEEEENEPQQSSQDEKTTAEDNGALEDQVDTNAEEDVLVKSEESHVVVPPLPPNPSGAGSSSVPVVVQAATPSITSQPKARLPHDTIGLLEDRIKEDERGDLGAWMALIAEYRGRSKFDEAREVYERFLKLFPHAAEVWVAYVEMELDNENFGAADALFTRSLPTVPHIQLFMTYLNYIRRRHDLTNDASGVARTTISQSYDFVLNNVGIDKDSGRLWQEYIQFVKSAPAQAEWQDKQRTDNVRKAYERAITVPMASVNSLWKEYDLFVNGMNKTTGRKFLQEKSPAYMSARSANTAMENITRGLIKSTLPKLPPTPGFDGDLDYQQQVELWKKWIAWEQEDPLALKDDEVEEYKKRIIYTYKQAVMALRFWPEIWVEAAEWCYGNGKDTEGELFLDDGIAANPESCLIAFKKADRLESRLAIEDAHNSVAEKGAIVRAPYDKVLDSLYGILAQLKERENKEMAKLEESLALDASIDAIISKAVEEEEEDETDKAVREAAKAVKTKAIEARYASQVRVMWRTISFAWIALMRAMRRVQGKGAVKDTVGGSRQIFADARARGKITSDVYVASALIEHHVYKDPAGTKIFERGAKLFPEDEVYILEYLKHLLSIGDTTNARVAFETTVSRLTQKGSEFIVKTKPLYSYFHKYESKYGELAQIAKLEQRMAEIFPEDPRLARFASRYSVDSFDPTAIRPIISPATQLRPKGVMQSIEPSMPVNESPRPNYLQPIGSTNSPKRPLPLDDFDSDLNRPRKLARGESPLKGAAGRRLNQQKALNQGAGAGVHASAPPFVVPRDITILLSIIPRAESYHAEPFSPSKLLHKLLTVNVPASTDIASIKRIDALRQAKQIPQQQVHQAYGNGGEWGTNGNGNTWSPAQPPAGFGAYQGQEWQGQQQQSQPQGYPPQAYGPPPGQDQAPYLQPASQYYPPPGGYYSH